MWTSAQRNRIAQEQLVLEREGMSQFSIYHKSTTDEYYLKGTATTSLSKEYTFWMPIPYGFPDKRPALYILKPNPLVTASGASVNALGMSHQMHTLSPGPGNIVQICHWRDDRWHAAITVHRVLLKGLLWLEAYEQHLQTGRPIADFVRTMREA